MSKIIELARQKDAQYEQVRNKPGGGLGNGQSSHGLFSIEDEEEDDDHVEIDFSSNDAAAGSAEGRAGKIRGGDGTCTGPISFFSTLTFSWMQPLLKTGNEHPLEMEDLYELPYADSAVGIYKRFRRGWCEQVAHSQQPSLALAFINIFGMPFLASGALKLIHDSLLFVGPQLLNALIKFLNDPTQDVTVGLSYVAGLFFANLFMSLCLRQYFWWCYRVGMNLRSSVVTSVYNKALAISVAVLSRKTLGEITNLMSVDSGRLQDLTPYLHAVWYGVYQVTIALYFLYQQVGVSCFAGMLIILLTIPLTGRVSMYLKKLQQSLVKIRDERVKLTNEVLTGMKVIKLQAWEAEFDKRIREVRERELATFKMYSIAVSLSGALYTSIPLMVSIFTFMMYIGLGNTLDVATALTSLALFDLLRFPLFMMPTVLNNIVEANVSIKRVEDFLLENEKCPVTTYPLRSTGVLLKKATMVWEAAVKRPPQEIDATIKQPPITFCGYVMLAVRCFWKNILRMLHIVSCGRFDRSSMRRAAENNTLGAASNPMITRSVSNTSIASSTGSGKGSAAANNGPPLSEEEFLNIVREAQLMEAEQHIIILEKELKEARKKLRQVSRGAGAQQNGGLYAPITIDGDMTEMNTEESEISPLNNPYLDQPFLTSSQARVLTLSRIDMHGTTGQLIAIVGQVGSGKSSILSSLLGDLRCCYGDVAVYGSIAYASQTPFVQNSTLRDNIIYGLPYDHDRYEATLAECALLPDIKVLPAGHDTEIGERGINLSGGQKARVGLARAVYADAEIYLLDDPLAAVDAHVGQQLFEDCILQLRKRGKVVILVTNALQFLRQCNQIIVLKDGHVAESGDYDTLLAQGQGFADMISTMQETGSSSTNVAGESKTGDDSGAVVAVPVQKDQSNASEARKRADSAAADQKSDAKVDLKKSAKLVTQEDREVGNVNMKVYAKWATAAGGICVGISIIIFFYIGELVTVISSWWLSYWSEHRNVGSPWFYLGVYIAINVFVVTFSLGRELYCRLRALEAGRSLFTELLAAVLFSPMSFFDTTPLGRIINRFSKDIYTIDEQIPQTVRMYLGTMAKVTSTIVYIAIITPLFLVGLLPILIFYVFAQRYYIRTSRELTRLESMSRSPIYALFSETLDGLSTIRAYKSEKRLIDKNNRLLDNNVKSYYLNFSANCWLAVRLEFAGTMIVTLAALFAVLARPTDTSGAVDAEQRREQFAGLAGLSISFALSVTQSLNWTVRMASQMESQMVSVERVKTYTQMPQEAAHHFPEDPRVARSSRIYITHGSQTLHSGSDEFWPQQGGIDIRQVTMRYRDGLPLVLRGLTLKIAPKEKVGIVGRTGAGKSSLLTALLRLVELEGGSIIIDGIDISRVGLNTLRSIMAVIPQDPVLFSGTVRSNLDPFGNFSDTEVWESIERALLGKCIGSLDDEVSENGANFSVGQRQLLCIARALLLKAKIIIMDEATAAVDVETDAMIQQTIRTEFAQATCLTVAHRLNTIMDSDKVLVMEQGRAAEYDSPQNLLANEGSMFYALVSDWENAH